VDFAVSDDKFTSISPNHYLFWEAIRLAYEESYRIFDFGRTSPNNKNLMDFKRRWGTQVIDLPQFYYPKMVAREITQQEETWKYKLMSKLCKDAPNSVQKIIGNFCYRHLG
jgi:lipid II:glycine glycyltransferase (peptidoglycan interpeptide bridge formation enzyme)